MAAHDRGVAKVHVEDGNNGLRVVVEYEFLLRGRVGSVVAAAGAAAAAAAAADGDVAGTAATAAAAAEAAAIAAAGGVAGVGVRDILDMLQSALPQSTVSFTSGGNGWGCCTVGGGIDDAVHGQLTNEARLEKTIGKQRNDLLLSATLTLPIFVITMVLPMLHVLDDDNWLQIGPHKAILQWVLSTVVQFAPGCGLRFYKETYAGLRRRNAGMAFLVCMGTSAAYSFAVYAAITYLSLWNAAGEDWQLTSEPALVQRLCEHGPDNFLTSSMLIVFISGGKYLELVRVRTLEQPNYPNSLPLLTLLRRWRRGGRPVHYPSSLSFRPRRPCCWSA
jgi:cation transport ATPase